MKLSHTNVNGALASLVPRTAPACTGPALVPEKYLDRASGRPIHLLPASVAVFVARNCAGDPVDEPSATFVRLRTC